MGLDLTSAARSRFRTRCRALCAGRLRARLRVVGTSNRTTLIAATVIASRARVRLVLLIARLLIARLLGPSVALTCTGASRGLRHGTRLRFRGAEGAVPRLLPVVLRRLLLPVALRRRLLLPVALRRRLWHGMRLTLRRAEWAEARL